MQEKRPNPLKAFGRILCDAQAPWTWGSYLLIGWSVCVFWFFTITRSGGFNHPVFDSILFFVSLILVRVSSKAHLIWTLGWILIFSQLHLHLAAWVPQLSILKTHWPLSPLISVSVGSAFGYLFNHWKNSSTKLWNARQKGVVCYALWLWVGSFVALYVNLKGFQGWDWNLRTLLTHIHIFSLGKPYHVLQPLYFSAFHITALFFLIFLPEKLRPLIFKYFLVGFCIFLIYGSLQTLFPHMGYRRGGSELNSFTEDLHSFSSFLVACTLFLLHYLHWKSRARGLVYAGIATLAVWLMSKTGSLNSWFGLILFLAPYSIWIVFVKTPKSLKTPVGITGIALLSGLLALGWQHPGIRGKAHVLINAKSFQEISAASSFRVPLIGSALRVVQRHPFTGYGTNNFVMAQTHAEYRPEGMPAFYENAHCYFVQVLADNGIIGFILWALVFLWPILSRFKTGTTPITFFLVGLLLTNLFAHSLLIFTFWLLYIFLLHLDQPDKKRSQVDALKP